MKILHLTDSLAMGGKERMCVELANASLRFAQVTICVTRSGLALAPELHPRVTLREIRRTGKLGLPGILRLVRVLRDAQPDVVHVHGRSSARFLAAIQWSLTRPLPGIVVHDHFGDVEVAPRFPWPYKWSLMRLRPQFVGVHDTLTAEATTVLSRNDCRTITNAVNLSRYRERREFRASYRVGLAIANVRPSKNLTMLIEGLARQPSRDWTVQIAGALSDSNYASRCIALRDSFGLQDNVILLGSVPDLPSLLAEVDFGLLSSATESGPLALIEYMAAGLPFCVTGVGAVAHAAREAGLDGIVGPGDLESFVQGVDQLITAPSDVLERRGLQGKELAERSYGIDVVMPQWKETYERAQSGRARRLRGA